MSRFSDIAKAPARADGYVISRLIVVRTVSGVLAAAGLLLLGVPVAALASPGGGSAPVVDLSTPVVAFYAGTAELDGSTTLEPTTTGTWSRLDCTILFGKDRDVLRPGARERLSRLAEQLRGQGAGRVQVTGYTDDLGSAAHGLDLSERRARRVAAELSRVLPARQFPTTVRGLGEAHPAVPNTSEANRRKNRRVTVTLTRTTTPPARATNAQPDSTPTSTVTSAPSVPAPPEPTPTEPTPTEPAATTTSPSAAPPSQSATPAVVPPPAPPGPSTSPSGPTTGVPWPWIGGAAAALMGLGTLLDVVRRRRSGPTGRPSPEIDTTPDADEDKAPTNGPAPSRPADQPQRITPAATSPSAAPSGMNAIPLGKAEVMDARPERPTIISATTVNGADACAPVMDPQSSSALDAGLVGDLAAWRLPDTHRPRLTLLGPVHARTRGQALARRRPYYTELFAYLALRPRGATVDEIAEDLHLTPARVRTDMKILRDWLGTDPRTGQLFLPDARTTPGALQRGIATYQLDGVLCDWHLFERLEAAATTAVDPDLRVAALEAAMDLVTGPPFARARPAGWGWLFEGDRVDLHAMKAVGDTAVKLIDYHHGRNDHQAAEDVLKTLTAIDPALAQELLSGAAS